MKYLMSLTMAAICFTSGCASSVVTYDSEGKMIGKCEAKKGFILGAGVKVIDEAELRKLAGG